MTRNREQLLSLDPEAEVEHITSSLRRVIAKTLRRQGVVVAVSGGVDSSLTAALCAKALGPDRVLALMMPERDSERDTIDLSRLTARHLGIEAVEEDITEALEAVGCYSRRDAAYSSVIPEFDGGWNAKIILPAVSQGGGIRRSEVVARAPDGAETRTPLPVDAYLQVVAATNFKQRIRKMYEYYHADLRNYAVVGTANRLELDQGFFVKVGDGAADVKPIAHLYKSQVYQLAEHLGIPAAIREREPTTDTYSLPQSQAEFYFDVSFEKFDMCLYGLNHRMPAEEIAELADMAPEEVARVCEAIEQRRRTTSYLQLSPILLREVAEVLSNPGPQSKGGADD